MRTVGDLMTPGPHTANPATDLATVQRVLLEHRIRHLPVVDQAGELVGLVTHRDLVRTALGPLETLPPELREGALRAARVEEVMRTEVITATPDTPIREAAWTLVDHKIGCLPVVEGRRLVGILTETDFVRLAIQLLDALPRA